MTPERTIENVSLDCFYCFFSNWCHTYVVVMVILELIIFSVLLNSLKHSIIKIYLILALSLTLPRFDHRGYLQSKWK